MDPMSKLKSQFKSPTVRGVGVKKPSTSTSTSTSSSTPSTSRSKLSPNTTSLKRPSSKHKNVDDDLQSEEGEEEDESDWIVGYQSTSKKQRIDSNPIKSNNPIAIVRRSNSFNSNPKPPSNSLSSQTNRSFNHQNTALTPRQPPAPNGNPNPSGSGSAGNGNNGERYYVCQWRKPQNKKHKTWEGDSVLIIHDGGNFCSLKCTETCKDLVTGAKFGHGDLSEDAELSVGGKDIQIEREISRAEYLGQSTSTTTTSITSTTRPQQALPPPKAPPFKPPQMKVPPPSKSLDTDFSKGLGARKTSNNSSHGTKPDDEAGENVAVVSKKQVSASSFYSSPTKNKVPSVGLTNPAQGLKPHPRFSPDAPGAIVMKRPDEAHQKKFNRKNLPIVDVVLDPALSTHLRPHQVEGVKFLYEIVMAMRHADSTYQGAILADEMGLGKTLQTIALCSMLLRQSCYYTPTSATIDRVLIVCPLSLVKNWKREFRKWIGNNSINVLAIDSSGQQKIESFVRFKTYQVLIIGYEKLRTCIQVLKGAQPPIGMIVCDEGHRLKSKDAKTTKMFDELATPRRIILSGTPIQNDLSEFYAMIDFVNPGLLGDYATFKKVFEEPIIKSRVQNARKEVRERGEGRTKQLAKVTSEIILRRTADLLNDFLLPKVEFVVFCSPTLLQLSIYKSVLGSNLMRQVLNGAASNPLVLIGHLRKLCNSPELLIRILEEKDKGEESVGKKMLGDVLKQYPRNRINCDPELSGKLMALMNILRKTRETTQDKVVVCSNFTATLDIIEGACRKSRYSFVRLDGKTKESDRMDIVNTFCFLLSAKSGGVGLNLIGANRLVLFDSDWNPATDLQVMARIHRDGQKKNCYIYRLLIAGTMDEKIFQRQLSKMGLSDSLMDSHAGSSKTSDSFSAEELRDIFRLHEDTKCLSHDHLCCSCGGTGKLSDSRNSGEGGDGVEERSEDEEEQGFMPASQHNVTQAQKTARDKRSKLVALFDWAHLDCTKPSASEELVDPILKAIVATQAPPRIISTQTQSQSHSSPIVKSKGLPLFHSNLHTSDSLLPSNDDEDDDPILDAEMDLLDQEEPNGLNEKKDQIQKKPSLLDQIDEANFFIKKEVLDLDPTSSPERSGTEIEKKNEVSSKVVERKRNSSPPVDADEENNEDDDGNNEGDLFSSSSQIQDTPSSGSFNISGMDPGAILYVFTKTKVEKTEETKKVEKMVGNGKGKGKARSRNEDENDQQMMEIDEDDGLDE